MPCEGGRPPEEKTNKMMFLRFLQYKPEGWFARFVGALAWRVKNHFRRMGIAVYDLSVRLAMGASDLCRRFSPRRKQAAAEVLGDVGFLLQDLFKINVWRMTGSGHTIYYVGSKQGALGVLPLFFDGDAEHGTVGEVVSFNLSRQTQKWLNEGCDMVICELSRLHPFRLRTPVVFTVPQWVSFQVAYPPRLETLIAGGRCRHLRNQINKFIKSGYQWKFSRSRRDFDFFYERLYLPFVRSRHGDHAFIAPYPYQWDLWIQGAGGGLVLITRNDVVVAGSICLVVEDVCYDIEMGVLDADEALIQKGIMAYRVWCAAAWGRNQGARFYNLGGTAGYESNGSFQWKCRWGASVVRRRYASRQLTFSAHRISPSLRERINAIGFIYERDDGFYRLVLDPGGMPSSAGELAGTIQQTRKEGLGGERVMHPHRRQTSLKTTDPAGGVSFFRTSGSPFSTPG